MTKTPPLDRLRAAILQPLPEPAPVALVAFEPVCLQRWSEQVAGMDDMGRIADAQQVAA